MTAYTPKYSNATGLPSVTTILRPWIDTKHFTEESRTRGSWVHEWFACYVSGAPDYLYPPAMPQWAGYTGSLRTWADTTVDDVLMVEKRLVDKRLGYCGQVDLVARLTPDFGGGVALVDIKTGSAVEKSWDLQGVAYAKLTGIQIDQIIFVRPKPDGSGCLPIYQVQDFALAWDLFMAAVALHYFFERGSK